MNGVQTKKGMLLIDPGSDTGFIRNEFAEGIGLKGEPVTCFLKVVGNEYRTVPTMKYNITLEDRKGNLHLVTALGLDAITTLPQDPDLGPIRSLLVGYPEEMFHRPQGRVDLLLGLRSTRLHGKVVRELGDLRVLETPFGCGWVLKGCHPNLSFNHLNQLPSLSANAHALNQAEQSPPPEFQIFHVSSEFRSSLEFHELEELGTTPAPVCPQCTGCRDCTF